jgi:hypothetical protein
MLIHQLVDLGAVNRHRDPTQVWTPVSGFRGDETLNATCAILAATISTYIQHSSTSPIPHTIHAMAIPRRITLLLSSVALILITALLLATALELQAPLPKMVAVSVAQEAKYGEYEREIQAKARINGTEFDRGDILNGTATASIAYSLSATTTPMTMTQEGLIGFDQAPTPSPSSSTPSQAPAQPSPAPPKAPQMPILAMSFSGSGGPKHCRGQVIHKMKFAPPAANWKEGACINLPSQARCGVFFAGKDDHCEAQLFNADNCRNNSMTYVNTVVFMPEERPVGALWNSMWVKCGVETPEASLIDPAILGGLIKPGKKGGG